MLQEQTPHRNRQYTSAVLILPPFSFKRVYFKTFSSCIDPHLCYVILWPQILSEVHNNTALLLWCTRARNNEIIIFIWLCSGITISAPTRRRDGRAILEVIWWMWRVMESIWASWQWTPHWSQDQDVLSILWALSIRTNWSIYQASQTRDWSLITWLIRLCP